MKTINEFKELYPNISFNDDPTKRDKDHFLFLYDTAPLTPESYDIKNIRDYQGVITWSTKTYQQLSSWGANVYSIGERPRFKDYGVLEQYTPCKNKGGICMIEHSDIHDLSHKQTEVFTDINGFDHFAYGSEGFGGIYNQGMVNSKKTKLEAIDKHRFVICFENVNHPLWSHNYLTENIFDCFRAKTIPVYLGASNINDIVPEEFYINYTDFKNTNELVDYLLYFNMDAYEEIVEQSYDWAIKNQWNEDKLINAFNKL